MLLTLSPDKQRIKKSFSEAVNTYDCSSDLQCYIADILASKIRDLNIPSGPILEFGCGTGLFTKRLLTTFPKRQIVSFDISFDMCKRARKKLMPHGKLINFLVSDAEAPALVKGHFSAIFSSSSFQWIHSPKKSLLNLKSLLLPEGIVMISTFGPKTLKELSYSLSIYFNEEILLAASNFLNKRDLIMCFRSCFTSFKIKEITITKRYPDLFSLLKTLKDTGANIKTSQLSSFIFTQKRLNLIDKIYKKEFGEIIVSYQVFLCEAKR